MKPIKIIFVLLLIALLAACNNGAEETADNSEGELASENASESASQPIATPIPPETESQEDAASGAESEAPAAESEASSEPVTETEAPSEPSPTPLPPDEPEEVTIEAADGRTLYGTFYPGSGSGAWPSVMLLHMNGGRRSDWDPMAQQLAEAGYAALTVDMRGHGDTGGQKDWEMAADDLSRFWSYMAGREDVDETRTAVAGASIGANMSLVTGANEPAIKTVVMLSPGLDYFGVTTDDRIVEYGQRPSLIIASEEDREAAVSSEQLHELALGQSELILYQGAGHGTNMFLREPELATEMVAWFDQHVKGETTTSASAGSGQPLFNFALDDRSPYQAGLIASEANALDQLPGAPVYHMDLAISPDLLTVAGQQEVFYTNQEDASLDEIYFHLYPNLLGGRSTISGLTVNGQPVEPELRNQETILRVPLPAPLEPGEQAMVGMNFEVDVPTEGGSNYGVFAAVDDVLALAHFYPQVAVYDDAGWNIDLPPPNADVTYADTGFYLVRVTAPEEQVLMTTGNVIGRQADGGDQILTIAGGPARDFYIASSDRYTVISDTVGETTVNSYGFSEFGEQNERVLEISTAALESMGSRFGDYPFTEFDVGPTPNLALGVEYPGAVVIRSELYDPDAQLGETPAVFYTEGTVAHEVGHQWFYSVVGNDQLNEPWLDEALTQYVTMLYFVDTYGPQGGEQFRDSLIGRWDRVDMAEIPIGMPAGEYDGREYGAIVYGRGPLFFEALAEEMGEETFHDFLRDYYQQNKWGVATGVSMKALAEEHCGCDLSPLFAEWVGDM